MPIETQRRKRKKNIRKYLRHDRSYLYDIVVSCLALRRKWHVYFKLPSIRYIELGSARWCQINKKNVTKDKKTVKTAKTTNKSSVCTSWMTGSWSWAGSGSWPWPWFWPWPSSCLRLCLVLRLCLLVRRRLRPLSYHFLRASKLFFWSQGRNTN